MILILDIDNTISDFKHRVHHIEKKNASKEDWKKFLSEEEVANDTPLLIGKRKEQFKQLLKKAREIHFITGRNEYLRKITEEWLLKHYDIDLDNFKIYTGTGEKDYIFNINMYLHMRPTGELSKATEHKQRALVDYVMPYKKMDEYEIERSEVIMAIEDDLHVLELYSEYDVITMKAPECWDVLFHEKPVEKELLFSK